MNQGTQGYLLKKKKPRVENLLRMFLTMLNNSCSATEYVDRLISSYGFHSTMDTKFCKILLKFLINFGSSTVIFFHIIRIKGQKQKYSIAFYVAYNQHNFPVTFCYLCQEFFAMPSHYLKL
jgi:hypothetical protein